MLRKVFLSVCMLLAGGMAFAQNILEVTDISQPNDVYSSASDEAAVVIRCHESIPLTFASTMDKTVEPFRTEVQGSETVYYLAFPTGNRYRGRVVTLYSPGYISPSISLDLQPKQLLTFKVSDPNALVDAGCYRGHRNRGMEEIKNSNYEEARNQFVVARECSDCDKMENDNNIQMVDSLIYYRQKGDQAFQLLDYVTAGNYYSKILALNSYDNYAANRNTLCVQNFTSECTTLFSKAEFYYNEKEWDKAKELYEKVVEKECRNMSLAQERLNSVNSIMRTKKDHARVLTYEYRKDTPIGFHYGKYNMHKAGGFFQLDLNNVVFDAARQDCAYGDEKFPEINMAFGWTIKIVNPVWIHFGPGFTGKAYYGTYNKKQYPTKGFNEETAKFSSDMNFDKYSNYAAVEKDVLNNVDGAEDVEKAWTKFNVAAAVSPVIGLTIKYSYFAIRATYQYRWCIQSDLDEFMNKSQFSFGVGFAF